MKAQQSLKERARYFRKNMTAAEAILWKFLRNRQLNGYKFIRQKIIEGYITDFICREKKFIIEVDGINHKNKDIIEYDKERTAFLNAKGYHVWRIENNEVSINIEGVLEAILNALTTLTPTPLPQAGEGIKQKYL